MELLMNHSSKKLMKEKAKLVKRETGKPGWSSSRAKLIEDQIAG